MFLSHYVFLGTGKFQVGMQLSASGQKGHVTAQVVWLLKHYICFHTPSMEVTLLSLVCPLLASDGRQGK